jgi:hypothetical protein
MTTAPLSGLATPLRHPDGSDEMVLREAVGPPAARALALLSRVSDGVDWADVTVTEFEAALLALRAQVFGEVLNIGFSCGRCDERVEVSFAVSDYLADIRPSRPADVTGAKDRPGWFVCQGALFRLPTVADQIAVAGRTDATRALAERCMDPPLPPARLRARVERAMAAMAPEVSRPLVGRCPACGAPASAQLYATHLVLAEFTRESAFLHEEVDLIARTYHWCESDILSLPRRRRQAYADRIRQAA